MPHELLIEDGNAKMMFVGKVPWHGLGTELTEAPKTAAKAITAAGLDWDVGLKPICCYDGPHFYEIPERKAVVRLDKWGKEDCVPFGLVGNQYQVMQNRDAFSFFDPIVKNGNVSFETAGALGNGERVWILAKVSGDIEVKSEKLDRYVLLSNGHDGRTALRVMFTPVRVVCQNTLSMAMDLSPDLARIYHTPGMQNRVTSAQDVVQGMLDGYAALERAFVKMAERKLSDGDVDAYLSETFPYPKPKKGQKERSFQEALAEVRRVRGGARKLFTSGSGNEKHDVKGSLWAAYNGVVELLDHHWKYNNRWQRMDWLLFGEGSRIKQRAYDTAVQMLKN